MSWLSFSLLAFLTTTSAWAQSFSAQECLVAQYDLAIRNPGQLFGLIKNDLFITKDGCVVTVKYHKLMTTDWKIDLCREPVHMKITSKGSQGVHKRTGDCVGKDGEQEYCTWKNELLTVIQDNGLIYAEGERDVLTTAHGQTYCAFLLLQKYLNQGVVFSKHRATDDIFGHGSQEVEATPVQAPNEKEAPQEASRPQSEGQF